MTENKNEIITQEKLPEKLKEVELDQYEEAGAEFRLLYENFLRLGYALAQRKKRAPMRILAKVLFEPLEDIKLYGKTEQEFYALCTKVLYNKNKLAEYAIKRHEGNLKETEGDTNV